MYPSKKYVKQNFINNLQIIFREEFPQYWGEFYGFIYSDVDRLCNFLAYCLQNFADADDAIRLEYILSQGGSGYAVLKVDQDASEYQKGVYDLVDRVSEVVQSESQNAISSNDQLMKAWLHCYSRTPDYEKVVIESQNFLEHFIRDTYEPGNTKPQLGKLVGNLKTSTNKLKFKGDTVINDKKSLLDLISNIANYRGMHTAGTGKKPSRQEAEYILHTTIYFWNLHQ
jgi:hypothetical protein